MALCPLFSSSSNLYPFESVGVSAILIYLSRLLRMGKEEGGDPRLAAFFFTAWCSVLLHARFPDDRPSRNLLAGRPGEEWPSFIPHLSLVPLSLGYSQVMWVT